MENCKHCGSSQIIKNGVVKNKQRYLCKKCYRTSRKGDGRVRENKREQTTGQ